MSPTFASMVGPGTCLLYAYPDTARSGAISQLVSAASSRTFTVFLAKAACVLMHPPIPVLPPTILPWAGLSRFCPGGREAPTTRPVAGRERPGAREHRGRPARMRTYPRTRRRGRTLHCADPVGEGPSPGCGSRLRAPEQG